GAQADRQAATARRVSRQGAFDLNLLSGSDFQRYNSTSQRGKNVTLTTTDAGAELLLRNGVRLYAGARLNTGAVKAPDSSTGTGGEYVVGVRVPLFRGFGANPRAASEQQAILGEPLATEQFRRTRLDVLEDAGSAYWNWVAAGQRLQVARNLLRVAEVRAEALSKRAELGDIPRVDAIEAGQEVARRQGLLIQAERGLQQAGFRLAGFRWEGSGSPAPVPTEAEVPPVSTLPEPEPISAAMVETARNAALATRPEVPANALQTRIARVDRDLAQNDTKPQVDFLFQPGADTGNKSIGDTLKVGFQFSLPLERRDATGRRDEADLRLERLSQDAALLRRQIVLEVDDAVSAVNRAAERDNATVRERDLAQQVENRERDRLRLGEGTVFLLNQRERTTAEAAQKVIDSRAEYFQAVLSLQVATGEL
ncbi:MAG: TolC family protein, partial [Armatimonadetes bacterium]|nr:TolC family protein [Armatimonadota bacterium]